MVTIMALHLGALRCNFLHTIIISTIKLFKFIVLFISFHSQFLSSALNFCNLIIVLQDCMIQAGNLLFKFVDLLVSVILFILKLLAHSQLICQVIFHLI